MECLSSVMGSTPCCFDRSYLKFNSISITSSATVALHLPSTCSLPFRSTLHFRRVLPPAAAVAEAAIVTAEPDTVSSTVPKKVLIPIGYGTEEIEAVILVHAFRRAGAKVTVASVEPQLEVEASTGLKLVADTLISSCKDKTFDLIALPGGMPGSARLRDCETLRKITGKHAEDKKLYGAICAAPAVTLLPWGLLKRKRSTCHPAFKDKISPFWAVKSNVQVSGELTTSRGPGTTYEFALSLVAQLFSESVAEAVKESLFLNTEDHLRKEEFNEVQWSFDQLPNVLIPVANGSEEIDIVTIVDILRRAKANVVVASVEKSLQILASQGTKITADKYIDAAVDSKYDLIIIPGGIKGCKKLGKSKALKKLLKEQEVAGRFYGEICSASSLLQKQGLLKDRTIAAHSSPSDKQTGQVIDSVKVIIDGNLITSKGLASSMDFALAIVSKLFGHARATSVAEGLVFEFPRS